MNPHRGLGRGNVTSSSHSSRRLSRTQCAAHAHVRCPLQELREQQSDGIQQAHSEKGKGNANQHSIILWDYPLIGEPWSHTRETVVSRAWEAACLVLFGPIHIEQSLHAFAACVIGQLDPH